MNDLERELRELLEEKSRDARVALQPPRKVLRRARRRQAGVALITALTVAALVVGSIAGLQAVLGPSRPQTVIGDGSSRTATIAGVSLTYPSEWTLVDLWPLASSIAVSTQSSSGGGGQGNPSDVSVPTGIPILQLSNHDLGLGPVCTGDTTVAGDNAVLHVAYDVDALNKPQLSTGSWPARLQPGTGACGDGYYAHWLSADGTPYLAHAGFGPEANAADRQAVFDAFASMSFRALELNAPAENTPGYVLDGGQLGGNDYTLEVRPAEGGGVDLSLVNGLVPQTTPTRLQGVGRPGDPLLVFVHSGLLRSGPADACRQHEGAGVVCWLVLGVASDRVASVEVRMATTGTFRAPVLPIPASLGSSFGAFVVQAAPETQGTIVALDGDGDVIAENPFGVTQRPSPSTTAATEAQTSLRNALAAARTYFTDGTTFAGFDPEVASSIEPSLTYNTSPTAVESEVSIRDVSATTVLLVTKASDGSVWCIADDLTPGAKAAGNTTYGAIDAQTVADCSGDVSAWG